MKKATLLKRIEKETKPETTKFYYPIKKQSIAYKLVLSAINGETLLRPCYTSGRGRYTSNMDHTSETMTILTAIGVKYEFGNDAPRGGLCGNFIKIITKIEQ